MTEQTVLMYCSTCNVQPEPVEGSSEVWRCPKCGQQDSSAVILEQGKAHAVEVAKRGWNDRLRDVAQQSKFLTFTPGKIDTQEYRWVSDLKLPF